MNLQCFYFLYTSQHIFCHNVLQKCQNGSIFLLFNRRQYCDRKYSDTILSTAPKCYLNIYDAHYKSIKGSPKMNMETFQEPQTNLSQIPTEAPFQMDQKSSKKILLDVNIYQAVYRKLLIQHRDLIQYLKGSTTMYKDLQLSERQRKIFNPYFNRLTHWQGVITPSQNQPIYQQLALILTERIDSIYKRLSERDIEQYGNFIVEISDKVKKWGFENMTIHTLLKIDIISLFLRSNQGYVQIFKRLLKRPMYSANILSRMFNVNKGAICEFYKTFYKLHPMLRYDYWDQIKTILHMLHFVQLRYRISNFRKREGKQEVRKRVQAQPVDLVPDMPFLEEQMQVQDHKYRFSEVAFIQPAFKKMQTVGFQVKQQISVAISLNRQLSSYNKRMVILKISIQHGIQLGSILQYVKSIEKEEAVAEIEEGRRIVKNLQICQWYFIQDTHQSDLNSIQKVIGIQIDQQDFCKKNGRYSFVWKNLYIMAMERLKLAQTVHKTQMKVLKQFQKDTIQVYISKWEYYYKKRPNKQSARDFYWPAVSQFCSEYSLSPTCAVYVLKSMPKVERQAGSAIIIINGVEASLFNYYLLPQSPKAYLFQFTSFEGIQILKKSIKNKWEKWENRGRFFHISQAYQLYGGMSQRPICSWSSLSRAIENLCGRNGGYSWKRLAGWESLGEVVAASNGSQISQRPKAYWSSDQSSISNLLDLFF